MLTTLFAFHGYSLNGVQMRRQLGELGDALGTHAELVCPDAPHTCASSSVDALYEAWRVPRLPPPHLSWWDASEDGSVYRGWEITHDYVRDLLDGRAHAAMGALGFSQGAMLVATLAALSSRGELPAIRCVVLVGGRIPRAKALQPLFDAPIRIPSLHVWGERDQLGAPYGPALVERFDPATREIAVWPGPHMIPTRGAAADAIIDFVRRHA